ncbi:unnamed protein product [Gadus morhua 'NCC']
MAPGSRDASAPRKIRVELECQRALTAERARGGPRGAGTRRPAWSEHAEARVERARGGPRGASTRRPAWSEHAEARVERARGGPRGASTRRPAWSEHVSEAGSQWAGPQWRLLHWARIDPAPCGCHYDGSCYQVSVGTGRLTPPPPLSLY